jgi:hypothetical protein
MELSISFLEYHVVAKLKNINGTSDELLLCEPIGLYETDIQFFAT